LPVVLLLVKSGLFAFVVVAFLLGALLVGMGFFDNTQTESGAIVPPESQYDPVEAGEPLPDGFRQLLPRDAILPIYNPTYVAAEASEWTGETLVLGIEIEGDARAYPISFLNRREMVVDRIAGIPILVTW
jgi:hypothetical protein